MNTTEKELKVITNALRTGETIESTVEGARSDPGSYLHATIALTDRRIVVKLLDRPQLQPIPMGRVHSIALRKGMVLTKVVLAYQAADKTERVDTFNVSKKTAEPFVVAVQQKLDRRPHKPAAGPVEEGPQRSRIRRFLDRTGTTEKVVFALTVGISVWAWLAFVVGSPQDVYAFGWYFLGANLIGATIQLVLAWFVRPRGTVRDRMTGTTSPGVRQGTSVVFWAPTIIYAIVFLAVTPPGTPTADVEYGWNIYQAIALFVALGFLASVCSILIYIAALPVLFIIDGLLPARTSGLDPMSRGEYIGGGVLMLGIFGFAISMQFIAPSQAASDFSRARMGQQFLLFATLHGALAPTIIAVLCIVAIVVGGIVSNRGASRRRRSWLARNSALAGTVGRGATSGQADAPEA